MKSALLLGLLVISGDAMAAPDYKYCEIAGLAFGAKKDFVGTVASRLVDRQRLTGSAPCVAAWASGYKVGERLSRNPNGWSAEDVATWSKLQNFEEKVADAVIAQMRPAAD